LNDARTSIMFRCGWQAFVALSSSAMVLAFGQSCSSADGTTDGLFESERNPAGAAGHFSGGSTAATGGRSSGGVGGRASGGSEVGAGGEVAAGGDATESGGRAAMGGRGSGGGRGGGKAGGAGLGAGPGSGGSAGELGGSGGTPNEGGAGGRESPVDCDDDDACTVDEPDTQGMCHFTPKCIARSECEVATCDAATGDCQFDPTAEGAVCDDQLDCTTGDVCAGGSCTGTSADFFETISETRSIPDGSVDCGGDQPVIVDFNVPEGGVVTAIEVGINVNHPNLANLSASLLHVQSNREAVLFNRLEATGRALNGRYLFVSGRPSFAEEAAEVEVNGEVMPERYAGVDDLASAFDGDQVQGTWRLTLTDWCLEDTGNFFGADLRIESVCE
jgi:subtilisin-like proprotein convertase family protein